MRVLIEQDTYSYVLDTFKSKWITGWDLSTSGRALAPVHITNRSGILWLITEKNVYTRLI